MLLLWPFITSVRHKLIQEKFREPFRTPVCPLLKPNTHPHFAIFASSILLTYFVVNYVHCMFSFLRHKDMFLCSHSTVIIPVNNFRRASDAQCPVRCAPWSSACLCPQFFVLQDPIRVHMLHLILKPLKSLLM